MTLPAPMDRAARTEVPLKSRSCGQCSECCIGLSIDTHEIKKEKNVRCPNLVADGCCGIYEARPAVCRTWHCAWRVMNELPDAARPDKSGVIISLVQEKSDDRPFEKHCLVAYARSMNDFDNAAVIESLDFVAQRETLPVWLHVDGRSAMVYPDAELADAILHPLITPHRHLLAKAAELRRRWQIEVDL